MDSNILEQKPLSTQHYDVESLGGLLSPDDLQPIESSEQKKTRRYGFQLGLTNTLLDAKIKQEVFENITIKPVPLMPEYIVGLCNVRGNLVPVYDLVKKYDLQTKSDYKKKYGNSILVMGQNEDMIGFVLNDSLTPIDLHPDDFVQSAPSADSKISSFVGKCYLVDGERWYELNYAELLKEFSYS